MTAPEALIQSEVWSRLMDEKSGIVMCVLKELAQGRRHARTEALCARLFSPAPRNSVSLNGLRALLNELRVQHAENAEDNATWVMKWFQLLRPALLVLVHWREAHIIGGK